jgi:hypothetical protein
MFLREPVLHDYGENASNGRNFQLARLEAQVDGSECQSDQLQAHKLYAVVLLLDPHGLQVPKRILFDGVLPILLPILQITTVHYHSRNHLVHCMFLVTSNLQDPEPLLLPTTFGLANRARE